MKLYSYEICFKIEDKNWQNHLTEGKTFKMKAFLILRILIQQ